MAIGDEFDIGLARQIFSRRDRGSLTLRGIGGDDPQAIQPRRLAHGVDRIKSTFALQRSHRRCELQCLRRGEIGDGCPEQDTGKQFILRQGGYAGEAYVGFQSSAAHMDHRLEVADVRLRINVERRISGGAPVELNLPLSQFEPAPGKCVAAPDQLCPARNGRAGDSAPYVEVGAPFAIEAQPRYDEPVTRARLDRQSPWPVNAGPFDLVPIAVHFCHAQFGDLGNRGRAAEREAAAVKQQVATDGAVDTVRTQGDRPGDRGRYVIPVEQCRILRLQPQIHAYACYPGEGEAARAGHGSAIFRVCREARHDQLCARKAPARLDIVQPHAGDGAGDGGIVGCERAGDHRIA